jgi:hypothetical protein
MMTSSFFQFTPRDILIQFYLVHITANLSDSGHITQSHKQIIVINYKKQMDILTLSHLSN